MIMLIIGQVNMFSFGILQFASFGNILLSLCSSCNRTTSGCSTRGKLTSRSLGYPPAQCNYLSTFSRCGGGGHSCVALTDWGECSQPPDYLDWDLLLPIFATNPDSRRTRHFVERRDPFIWGMPTWTRLELGKG